MTTRPWEACEDKVIKRYPTNLPLLIMLLDRSPAAIHARRQILGVRNRRAPCWTKAEDQVLRCNYAGASWPELCALLPNRTRQAIKFRAMKTLHLRRSNHQQRSSVHLPPIIVDLRRACEAAGVTMGELGRAIGSSQYALSPARIQQAGVSHEYVIRAAHYLGGELYVEWED